MIFTSIEFVVFFAVLLLIRSAVRNFTVEKWILLIASWLFYMSWNPPFVILIIGISVFDYFVGRQLERTDGERARKTLLIASLAANLGLLAFFKYTNFLLGIWNDSLDAFGVRSAPIVMNIILPAGISFHTFQSMSYTIDVYRRQLPACHSLRDFMLFVAFFPQLVAGPIVRATEFLPQLYARRRASWHQWETGLSLFALGAIKKLVISDQISPHVDIVFNEPALYDGISLLLATLGFGTQIYCDFSGYSDMAIGSARLLGYELPTNFAMPYSSTSITEFWRRWHISLSTWLRDYLYIPLGGNRRGNIRTEINLMLTMLLGGLWHGASWNFIVWGGLHGAALVIHKMWRRMSQTRGVRNQSSGVAKGAGWLLTMTVVFAAWVFFRAPDLAASVQIIWKIVTVADGLRMISPQIIAALLAIAVVHILLPKDIDLSEHVVQTPVVIRIAAYTAAVMTIFLFGARESSPFIYFQF